MKLLDNLLRLHPSAVVPLEDFFTEVCAGLFRYHPELCLQWLEAIGAVRDSSRNRLLGVSTQAPLPALESHETGSRPDMVLTIRTDEDESHLVFVESKVASSEREDQLWRYADHLDNIKGSQRKTLVYVTRHYDPKDEPTISGGEDVNFVQARWSSLYQSLKSYQRHLSDEGKKSELVEEVTHFMEANGMSQQNRLSATDVAAIGSIARVLSFMRETLSSEVRSKIEEVSGTKIAGRNQKLRLAEDQGRYFEYAFLPSGFWCGAGFYLETETPEEYPWLTVLLEVGPRHPQRADILEAMKSFERTNADCTGYSLDDPSAWSGLGWWMDVAELLGQEDHMSAARNFFIESLEQVKTFREQHPGLPWGTDR